jgi:SAM-dependent methyltransferase
MAFTDPRFVHIYEQIDGDRTEDIEFYRGIARTANGPLLEAGCGSGRILLPLLQEGIAIFGFDPSSVMLEVLGRRASEIAVQANVWQGDFGSILGKYSAILSPFNSVMHLLKQEEQIDAFRTVHGSLDDDGVFAFDIANPLTLDIYDDEEHFSSTFIDQRSGNEYEIWQRFEHDPLTQTGKFHREFRSKGETLGSTIDFRWTYPSEITLLLQVAGFREWEVFGDFNRGPLTEESSSQVWIARKREV